MSYDCYTFVKRLYWYGANKAYYLYDAKLRFLILLYTDHMKKLLLTSAVIAMTASMAIAATPKRLASITETEYSSSEVTSFSYDTEGRLIKVSDNYSTIDIDYSGLAAGKIVITDTERYDKSIYEVTLNELGLIISAVENDGDVSPTTREFAYTNGKLSKVTIIDGKDKEYIDISWENSLLTSYVETESWDNDIATANFSYSGVANTGNLAMLDEIYGLDLDDLEYLAIGGYFGEIPSELPTAVSYKDEDGTQSGTVIWELDADGYPVKLTSSQSKGMSTSFAWEVASTGIGTLAPESNGLSKFYSIDGRELTNPTEGIVIELKADGTTIKRVIR